MLRLLDMEAGRGGWAEGRLQALVYTYAFTGLRKCEALMLEHADIDLGGRILTVRPKQGWRPKTVSSAAELAIAEPLADVLGRWIPRTGCKWLFPGRRLLGPWLHGYQGTKPLDQVKAAGQRAGIEGLTILGFRKSIGTLSKSWGITQLERKSLLRHTSVQTGESYDEPDRDLSRHTVSKIHYSA
ncbi:MAG TPA: site-specific integrase [Isosphaeraceae bacterium]|nr:site-specific integrase [Isosphaeraceae bacterium]